MTPCLVRARLDSGKQITFFFYSSSIPPQYQNLCRRCSFLEFYLCVWHSLWQRGEGHSHEAEKHQCTGVLHENTQCGFAPLSTQKRFQAVLAARARQDSWSKGMEGVQTKARINVSFSHANRGKKLFAESHFPSFSMASSWHVTICLVCKGIWWRWFPYISDPFKPEQKTYCFWHWIPVSDEPLTSLTWISSLIQSRADFSWWCWSVVITASFNTG